MAAAEAASREVAVGALCAGGGSATAVDFTPPGGRPLCIFGGLPALLPPVSTTGFPSPAAAEAASREVAVGAPCAVAESATAVPFVPPGGRPFCFFGGLLAPLPPVPTTGFPLPAPAEAPAS